MAPRTTSDELWLVLQPCLWLSDGEDFSWWVSIRQITIFHLCFLQQAVQLPLPNDILGYIIRQFFLLLKSVMRCPPILSTGTATLGLIKRLVDFFLFLFLFHLSSTYLLFLVVSRVSECLGCLSSSLSSAMAHLYIMTLGRGHLGHDTPLSQACTAPD